jgi:hypothetical protein
VPWDQATRVEARDFSRWVQVGGKPESTRWPRSADGSATQRVAAVSVSAPKPNRVTGRAAPGPAYAPTTASHGESVLRAFYDLHVDTGQGPMVNPFPLVRERRRGRAGAHRNPMEPYRNQRAGLYRPKLVQRPPRCIPDEKFNELFAQLVRSLGRFPGNAPPTTRAFHVFGQMSIEEMVGRYGIQCRPIRDLLVDYLREFEVSLDYNTLLSLSFVLARLFWRDLELHHPGIASLRLPSDVAAAWKQRISVKTTTVVESGELVVHHAPRLSAIQYMGNVRSFYLDIAQ